MNKVFLPGGWIKNARDQRKDPDILPGTVWVTLFIGFVLQAQSLEELERRARVCFKKLLPRKQTPPSADTIKEMVSSSFSGMGTLEPARMPDMMMAGSPVQDESNGCLPQYAGVSQKPKGFSPNNTSLL